MKHDLPDVHFGSPQNKPLDWRKMPDKDGPDDDADRKPPASVRKILKVDPYKLFEPKPHKNFHEESSVNPGWWDQLTREEQEDYIKAHPKTRLKINAVHKNTKLPKKQINKLANSPVSDLLSKVSNSKDSESFLKAISRSKTISEETALGCLKIAVDRNFETGAPYTEKLFTNIKSKDGQIAALKMLGGERLEDEQLWITPHLRGDTLDEASKHVSNYYFDLFSAKYSKFLASFDDIWLGEGSSEAHRRVWVIYKNYGNKKLHMPVPLTEGEEVISQNFKTNIGKLHNKTKLYLMKKYKIKDVAALDHTYVTLYRGLGHAHENYIPSPTESWADDFESAKSYADLGEEGSVIETKVPLSSILFTEKSLERNEGDHGDGMRAKEEFVVLGGAIDRVKTIHKSK